MTPKLPNPEADLEAFPLLAHLYEFRQRLVTCFLAFLAGVCVCYLFAADIYSFLVHPLAEATASSSSSESSPHRLIYTGLAEAFMTYLRVALWGGFVLALPVIAYQIWRFVAPGLFRHERRFFLALLFSVPLLFLAGGALAYFFVFPMAWSFFLSFEIPASAGGLPIQMEARVSEYLALSMSIIAGFGLAFQLPVILVLLARMGIVSAAQLGQFRRFAVVLIFAAAAVLTPPDAISQVCLAVPMVALYEIAILAARWVEKKQISPSSRLDVTD